MKFTIVVAKHDTEPHTARYDDFVRALGDSLRDLGHEVTGLDNPGRLICFNINNTSDPAGQLPEDAILFNTEQLAAMKNPRLGMTAYETHRKRVVWDYSESNAAVLRDQLGMERVVMCPVGYHRSMTHIESAAVQDVDVLFYGALTPRRTEVLYSLKRTGLNLKCLYGVYGAERDAWIARSKVVVNLHYGFEYDSVFEIFRVSHLLANSKCVVTEAGGVDKLLEDFASYLASAKRKDIATMCEQLVRDDVARRGYERWGFTYFNRTCLTDNVRLALEQS